MPPSRSSVLLRIRPWLVLVSWFVATGASVAADGRILEADLLVVGGTESGCAAVVQAARMGVERIVLVNDIEWLGGQFSSEGLGAIDENRSHGYDGTVPIPRSGIFRDVIDAIEEKNAILYGGVRRPGNTRVITTSRPKTSEQVFRELLAPFEQIGRIRRFSGYQVDEVLTADDRVIGAVFCGPLDKTLTVRAAVTIDASDWGDVIKGSGAKWDAGIDSHDEYNEPSAPASAEPVTDLNPITWCMILEQQQQATLVPKPAGYDPTPFKGQWGWIKEDFAYSTRRLVDGRGFDEIDHPDVLLINNPSIDYPLDTYPKSVAAALEETEPGASHKNLVAMTRQQREIVFADARQHSLRYYYYLQQNFPKFRFLALSDEFGTADRLPPKPYIREGLRLVARHIVTEQEVVGVHGARSYANIMFPDAVFCWQFELDFHPTRRHWLSDAGDTGPWEASFRGNRRFGRGGTGRAVFPLRALLPEATKGLIGAQKNLGYTSIVGSSCRLHDQSIHAGQAAGAVAAVSLQHAGEPGDPAHIPLIWSALLDATHGAPLIIWPFSDLDPFDPDCVPIQQLALRRGLGLEVSETAFLPDEPAEQAWVNRVVAAVKERGYQLLKEIRLPLARREVARQVWAEISDQPVPPAFFQQAIPWQADPARDGLPESDPSDTEQAFNFTVQNGPGRQGWTADSGKAFRRELGFGWRSDISTDTRFRKDGGDLLRSGFVFTRAEATWECALKNGLWKVTACLGDASHPQPGQCLRIEGVTVAENLETQAGEFCELSATVLVEDGFLTVTLGKPEGQANTCINWLLVGPAK